MQSGGFEGVQHITCTREGTRSACLEVAAADLSAKHGANPGSLSSMMRTPDLTYLQGMERT